MNTFSHIANDGSVKMVDVGAKKITERAALAESTVVLNQSTYELLQQKALPKGDVLTTAKIAGIMAAKRTAELIPFCHSLQLSQVEITFELQPEQHSVRILAEAKVTAGTGVEMEALCAAQVAALTIYDMCKAAQKDILITNCRLLRKSGGRSGIYQAPCPGCRE